MDLTNMTDDRPGLRQIWSILLAAMLAAMVMLADCAASDDVEQVRHEQAQAKAKMSAELQQERGLAASMEKESEAQKAAPEKLAKALRRKGKPGSTSCPTPSNQLNVQVVNDSGYSDTAVYMLLTGKNIGWPAGGPASGLAYLDTGASPQGTQLANALTNMTPCGTIVSAYTGNTLDIYQFAVSAIAGARLMVSYTTAVGVTNGNFPTGTESFRWDKMEFGYPNSGADLTSLDFFGIPMQFDYLDGHRNILTTMTYYTSTPTLLSTLYSLSSSMGNAFQGIGKTSLGTWTPDDPLSQFARVVGPSFLASSSSTGSPAPYPSFSAYLTSVIGQSFTLSGNGNAGCPPIPYTYAGAIASDNAGGYQLNLSGTMTGTPCGINSQGAQSNLPANLPIQVTLPVNSFDFDVYGAPATAFTVPGMPANLQQYVANSLYAVIAGDFLAAMNFGYVGNGSNAPQNSASWYSNPPTLYPFGGARTTNDGFYNPYAAVFYNLSDAYGFAYSDRGGRPSPYVPLPSNATTMRITLLNDTRLDAPLVTVSNQSTTSLMIQWPVVTNATGYTVNVTYGGGIPVQGVTLSPSTPSPGGTTISGLSPGTTYAISVTATGQNPIQSYAVPVYGTTSGSMASPAGTLQFGTALNWSVNASGIPPSAYQFTINGSAYTLNGANASIAGAIGTNVYGLTITDGSTTIYQGNYVVILSQQFVQNAFLTPPNSNLLTTAWAGGGGAGFPAGPFPDNGSLVIGTPFAPVANKMAAPVVFPTP